MSQRGGGLFRLNCNRDRIQFPVVVHVQSWWPDVWEDEENGESGVWGFQPWWMHMEGTIFQGNSDRKGQGPWLLLQA